MKTNSIAPDYKGFRFPPEIISHAVWLYFRFSLSFRDVEELLAQRGIVVTYETVRQWCLRVRANVRQWTPSSSPALWRQMAYGRGLSHDPWRETLSVASSGPGWQCARYPGAELPQQESRQTFFRAALLKGLQYVPRVIITDKLRSYGAAKREVLQGWEHRQHKYLGHPSGELASTHAAAWKEDEAVHISPHRPNASSPLIAPIAGHFQPRRHRLSAGEYRTILQDRFQQWNEVTGVKLIA
jgi:putative transposase